MVTRLTVVVDEGSRREVRTGVDEEIEVTAAVMLVTTTVFPDVALSPLEADELLLLVVTLVEVLEPL